MGRINVAGWVLALGAVGQSLMLGNVITKIPFWIVFVPFLGPYLVIHVISFCRVAPCGPRRFAQILTFAMAWYVVDTLDCELIWLFLPAKRSHMYPVAVPHVLAYGCAVSFVILLRGIRDARQYAIDHPEKA